MVSTGHAREGPTWGGVHAGVGHAQGAMIKQRLTQEAILRMGALLGFMLCCPHLETVSHV